MKAYKKESVLQDVLKEVKCDYCNKAIASGSPNYKIKIGRYYETYDFDACSHFCLLKILEENTEPSHDFFFEIAGGIEESNDMIDRALYNEEE